VSPEGSLVAARLRPAERSRRRRPVVVGMTALAALGLPVSAQAHGTAAVSALDFEARVTSVGRDAGSITATVIDGDRQLELRVRGSHTVVVLGYGSEPFLRFSPVGVAVNDRSQTAIADKLARPGVAPALDPHAPPSWSMLAVTDRYVWRDHRLGPRPGRTYGQGAVASWAIPVVLDGRPDRIVGRLWHAHGPPLWPWLTLLGLALVAAAGLSRQRRRGAERVAMVCAAIAGVAAEVLSLGLSFGPGVPSSTAWVDVPTSAAIAAVAVTLFVRVPEARDAVSGLVGLVAPLVALGDASVLVRGYVISSLSPAVIRAAAATAVCAGVIAAVSVAARLLAPDRPTHVALPGRPTMMVPRGKARSR
jgi:hypothetical protein